MRLRLDSWGCGHFRAYGNLVTRGGWDGEGGGKLGGCLLEGGSLKKKNQGGLTEVGAGEESLDFAIRNATSVEWCGLISMV